MVKLSDNWGEKTLLYFIKELNLGCQIEKSVTYATIDSENQSYKYFSEF